MPWVFCAVAALCSDRRMRLLRLLMVVCGVWCGVCGVCGEPESRVIGGLRPSFVVYRCVNCIGSSPDEH